MRMFTLKQFRSANHSARWTDPFALYFYSLIPKIIRPDFSDGLNFVTCEHCIKKYFTKKLRKIIFFNFTIIILLYYISPLLCVFSLATCRPCLSSPDTKPSDDIVSVRAAKFSEPCPSNDPWPDDLDPALSRDSSLTCWTCREWLGELWYPRASMLAVTARMSR